MVVNLSMTMKLGILLMSGYNITVSQDTGERLQGLEH